MNALPEIASENRSERAPTAYSWFVVFVLLTVGIVSYLDRNITALLIEPIKADLGITAPAERGRAMSTYNVANYLGGDGCWWAG